MVIAGSVMVGVAVLGVLVTVSLLGRNLDPDELTRDVVFEDGRSSAIPGEVDFRVIEDLTAPESTMDVGIALEPYTADTYNSAICTFTTSEGAEVDDRPAGSMETFLSSDFSADDSPFFVADNLTPGGYTVSCDVGGEPSAVSDAEFSVGRVVSPSELLGVVGPVLWIFASVILGGIVGVIGVVLLVIGLVRQSRARQAGWPGAA